MIIRHNNATIYSHKIKLAIARTIGALLCISVSANSSPAVQHAVVSRFNACSVAVEVGGAHLGRHDRNDLTVCNEYK